MNNNIGFSTGAIYSWSNSINKQIDILKSIKNEAIEINFGKISDLDEEITKENIEYLKSLNYISIHAPFFNDNREDLYYDESLTIKNLLSKLESLYEKIGANAVVLHPNLIKDYSIFKDVNFNICIENMPIKRNVDINSFEEIIKKYAEFKIILDTAHALTWNDNIISEMILKFREKISHVHFSDRRFSEYKQKVSDHQQLLFCDDLNKFKLLRELDCPIIIEVSIKDKIHDITNLEEEYKIVKKFF